MTALGTDGTARIGAEAQKQQYDEYIRAGFTKTQAFELVKSAMCAAISAHTAASFGKNIK